MKHALLPRNKLTFMNDEIINRYVFNVWKQCNMMIIS